MTISRTLASLVPGRPPCARIARAIALASLMGGPGCHSQEASQEAPQDTPKGPPELGVLRSVAQLPCGSSVFVLRTERREGSLEVLDQQLSLRQAGLGRVLAHEGRLRRAVPGHPRVMDAWVSGWACVQSRQGGPWVYALFTCHAGLQGCQGTRREWGRLYAQDGQLLNPGHARSAQPSQRLMRRLGLAPLLAQGIALDDAVP